jgi:hypothetical protein
MEPIDTELSKSEKYSAIINFDFASLYPFLVKENTDPIPNFEEKIPTLNESRLKEIKP